MIRHHLKIVWRNILRYKSHSLITISGLTAGTVCFLYILLYVNDQLGYDEHHRNADQLYRVCTFIKGGNGSDNFNSATASPPIAFGLKNDFPEVHKDYHFNSLKAPIVPLMNLYSPTPQTLVCEVTGDSYGRRSVSEMCGKSA